MFLKNILTKLELVKLYVKRFCDLTNDDEVNNRLSRYDYQYKAFKEDPTKNIYHIKALADKLKANFPRFDEFKIKDGTAVKVTGLECDSDARYTNESMPSVYNLNKSSIFKKVK